ncbi:MAG TPA: hypothetical protein VJ440_05950, partial [Candidatus Brocadiaceae bacterium]|nr:hypothetical protein [Candidatus Brocadiaceae bacterium]
SFSLIESNSRGSLTTRKSYGLKGYTALSRVVGDEWGLEATASSLPAALLAQQALKGRYWGQNNGSFGITPFQGLLVFPCPQGVALG